MTLDKIDFILRLKEGLADYGDAFIGRIAELRQKYLYCAGLLPNQSWQGVFKTEAEYSAFKRRYSLARKSAGRFDAYDLRRIIVSEVGALENVIEAIFEANEP